MSCKSDSQIRVRFFTKHEEFKISEAPFALPAKLGRSGLSEVLNHLLDLPIAQPFDFIVNDILIRSPLYKIINALNINTEDLITIEYFPAISLNDPSKSIELPAWVGSIDISTSASPQGTGIAGCYDGSFKIFNPSSLEVLGTVEAHVEPIRAVKTWVSTSNKLYTATASKDNLVKLWDINKANGTATTRAILKGHQNSVESLAYWQTNQSDELLLSGDWSGNIFAWKLPSENESLNQDDQPQKKKKSNDESSQTTLSTLSSLFSIKGHGQSISSIKTQKNSNLIYTSSWDYSVKLWDMDRQDCLQTINSGKVITSIDYLPEVNNNYIISSHSDGDLRLWDLRSKSSSASKVFSLPSNRHWLAQCQWKPASSAAPLVASINYNGEIALWDLRSSSPLGLTEAHDGKGLTLAFNPVSDASEKSYIISGGSDCSIKSSSIEV